MLNQIWVTRKLPEKKGNRGRLSLGHFNVWVKLARWLPASPMPYLVKEGSSFCLHILRHISTMGTDQLAVKPYQRGFKHRAESPFSIRTHNSPPDLHISLSSSSTAVPVLLWAVWQKLSGSLVLCWQARAVLGMWVRPWCFCASSYHNHAMDIVFPVQGGCAPTRGHLSPRDTSTA